MNIRYENYNRRWGSFCFSRSSTVSSVLLEHVDSLEVISSLSRSSTKSVSLMHRNAGCTSCTVLPHQTQPRRSLGHRRCRKSKGRCHRNIVLIGSASECTVTSESSDGHSLFRRSRMPSDRRSAGLELAASDQSPCRTRRGGARSRTVGWLCRRCT
jgi:hypothetical protein